MSPPWDNSGELSVSMVLAHTFTGRRLPVVAKKTREGPAMSHTCRANEANELKLLPSQLTCGLLQGKTYGIVMNSSWRKELLTVHHCLLLLFAHQFTWTSAGHLYCNRRNSSFWGLSSSEVDMFTTLKGQIYFLICKLGVFTWFREVLSQETTLFGIFSET